ncbi:MAG: BppU family phage baseplate upper protein [bacterium]
MSDELHKNDIGTVLTFRIIDNGETVDLTNATSATLVIVYPETTPSKIEKTCTILSPEELGKVQYTIQEDDLPDAGTYEMQIIVEFSDGDTFHTDVFEEIVLDNL